MACNHTFIYPTSDIATGNRRVVDYERLANKTFDVAVFLTNVVNASRLHSQLCSSPSMVRVRQASSFFENLRLRYIGLFNRPRFSLFVNEVAFDCEVRKLFSGAIQKREDIWPCYADIFNYQDRPRLAMRGLEHIAGVFERLMQAVCVLCAIYTINLL